MRYTGNYKMKTLRIILAAALLVSGCDDSTSPESTEAVISTPAADRVLTNGHIYTVNPQQPWVEAVAIRDGRYVYAGTTTGAAGFIGESTDVMDLAGRMAMPGINDAHVHPIQGGTKALFECSFPFIASPDEIAARVTECVAAQPQDEWIRGGQWSSDFFVNHPMDSPREWLDRVSGNKAVALADDALHNTWFNSKALQLLGITRDAPDPPGTEVVRDPVTGEPSGVVIESFGFVTENLHWSPAQYLEAADYAVTAANREGITGFKAAGVGAAEIGSFNRLAQSTGLTAHVAAALITPYGHREQPLDVAELIALRDTLKSSTVDTSFVKIFMDGVPTASRTAAMGKNGRAASCTSTSSRSVLLAASARAMDSWRVAPPFTTRPRPSSLSVGSSGSRWVARSSGCTASTISQPPWVLKILASRRTLRQTTASPPTGTNTFGTCPPRRVPRPAARTRMEMLTAGEFTIRSGHADSRD